VYRTCGHVGAIFEEGIFSDLCRFREVCRWKLVSVEPVNIRQITNYGQFSQHLKIHLFNA